MITINEWAKHLEVIAQRNEKANRSKLANAYRRISEGKDHWWVKQAVRCIHYLAKTHDEIAADDVWEAMHHLTPPNNPSAMGLAFKIAHRSDIIESQQKFRKSRRKSANGRDIRIWKVVKEESK